MPSYSVAISGLSELSELPGWLDGAQRELLEKASKQIAEEVGDSAPRKSGRLASSWKGKTISSTQAIVSSDNPYAKAQDKGAYIRPKNRQALRFRDGHVQSKAVRLPPTNYVKRGLRSRGKIIRAVYAEAFGNIEGKS